MFTTSKRTIAALLYKIKSILENGLFHTACLLLRCLPTRTLANLKHSLSPVTQLDYHRHKILVHADSELGLYRARACRKEPETVCWIEETIRPGEVLYDIGANVGAYSLVASKFCGGKIVVHAFEPSFSTYYQLCRNIILNNCEESIIPHMIGLTKKTGPVVFNYSSLEAGSSLHALVENEKAPELFHPLYRQRILGFSLDDLVVNFDFPVPHHIKLDVDGPELDILYGATHTLERNIVKSILVEVGTENRQADAVTEFLNGKNFYLFSRTDRGDGITWNFIFKHQLS
jgi:FkbM family methyltransferase